MATLYRIERKKGLVPLEKREDPDELTVEIYTLEEFERVDLGDDDVEEAIQLLSRSRGTFANMLPDCIIGSLSFPDKEDLLAQPTHFGFFLNPKRLILIDDYAACRDALEALTDLGLLDSITTPRILFEFMKSFVSDDSLFLAEIEKTLTDTEENIVDHEGDATNQQLLGHRRKLLMLDRNYQQLTDMTGQLSKDEYLIMTKEDRRLFRLFSQQAERLFQRAQYLKEYSLQLRELYQMQIDIQQNKTIQWLTVITTLFVPLTLITSWYGMNFTNMPELHWPYSYFVLIGICIVIVILQLIFFKKRKWL